MTILDAEYLEHSTYVDYNKPFFSNLFERELDNTKVIANEWFLKPQYQQAGVHTYDKASGHFNNDISYNNRSVVVVGTELQIYNLTEAKAKRKAKVLDMLAHLAIVGASILATLIYIQNYC